MKRFKQRLRNYGLWLAVASLGLIVLQAFRIPIVESDYERVVNAVLTVLVLAGVINDPTTRNKGFGDD